MCDFSEISAKMKENLPNEQSNVREFCINSSIMPLSDFHDCLAKEMFDISSQITPSKERPTVEDFKDIFKDLEDYPANLQKPKKLLGRELSRMNSMTMKADNAGTMSDLTVLSDVVVAEKPSIASASDIYNGFKRYHTKLSILSDELRQNAIACEHANNLKQLKTFSQQLDKLLTTKNVGEKAFTSTEEDLIQTVATNLEHLKCIHDHQHIYQEENNDTDFMSRLKSINDILEYTLQNQNFN